jgi:hypothetical protein
MPQAESRCPAFGTAPMTAKGPSGYGMEAMRCTDPQQAVAAEGPCGAAARSACPRNRLLGAGGLDWRFVVLRDL